MSNKLEIKIGLQGIAKIKEQLGSVRSGFEHLKSSIFSLKGATVGILTGVGLYKLNELLEESANLAAEEQKQMLQLRAVMVSMHRNVKGFTQSLIELADAQELATGFGNEQIMSAEHMLATFSTISNKVMPDVLKTTEDLARGWGIDLTQAARIMGVASMGLVGQLTRYGITLSDEAKKTKDFNLILRDIQEQVSGSAEAFRYSTTGIRQTFKSLLDDSKKVFGRIQNAVLDPFFEAATQMIAKFNKKFKSIDANSKLIKDLQNTILSAVSNIIHAFGFLYNAGIEIAKGIQAITFFVNGLGYAGATLLSVFSDKYKKAAKDFQAATDKAAFAYVRLSKDKISTKAIDDFIAKYKKNVIEADKTISAERKKTAGVIIGSHKKQVAAISADNAHIIVEKQKLNDALEKLSLDRFDYQRYLLGKQVVEFEKAHLKMTDIAKFAQLGAKKITDDETKYKVEQMNKILRNQAKIAESIKKTLTDIQQIGKAAAQGLQQSFQSFFFDAMQLKLHSLLDYFKSFARSVEQVISQMLAKKMVAGILGLFTSSATASAGGNIGIGSGGYVIPGAANGGILKGGFKAFATGGIATEPTLGLIGEGKYNEAVVPLPDGKSIPVKGMGTKIQVNINNQTGQPLKGEQGDVQFDGEQYIVNVILKNAQNYGSIYHLIRGGAV